MRVEEVVLFCLFVAAPALGQGPDDGRASARVSFREGLARAQQGDSAGALLAFETAYAASPHHSVLYNIGQTQLALGRPVDAVTTFERYLVEGRDQIPLARRSEVLELIGLQRKRIGWLRIIGPSDRKMLVWVDGVPISAEQLAGTIPLQQGKHHVLAASGAGLPDAVDVEVTGEMTTELPLSPAPRLTEAWSQIVVTCPVPGMTVTLNGNPLATTPTYQPVLAPIGAGTIRFTRLGYRAREQRVVIERNRVARLHCEVEVERPLSRAVSSTVMVRPIPRSARVSVDGTALTGPLPLGVHELRVEHPGYVAHRRQFSLQAGQALALDIELQAQPETLQRREMAIVRRRWGYLLAGTGGALLLGAASLLVWNVRRHEAWLDGKNSSSDFDRVASIQRADDLALGVALLGIGSGAAGTWLLLSEGEP